MNEEFLTNLLNELNTQLEGFIVKVVLDNAENGIKFKIKLRNERGLDSYILNISDEVFNDINNFYYNYKFRIVWNNTRDTFRLYEK